jgi:hypothetical protein
MLCGQDINEDLPRGMPIELGNIREGIVTNNIIAHPSTAGRPRHAINIIGNVGPVYNLVVADNIIHDWRGMRAASDDLNAIQNVLVQNNIISGTMDEQPLDIPEWEGIQVLDNFLGQPNYLNPAKIPPDGWTDTVAVDGAATWISRVQNGFTIR